MDPIQALILGIVQGLTEFIPISSSGHLTIIPELLGWSEQTTAFDIVVHAGTLFALIIFFRKKLYKIGTKVTENKNEIINLTIGSVPAIIAAGFITILNLITSNSIDLIIKNEFVIVFMLVFIGILFILSDKVFATNSKSQKAISKKDALIIGLGQCLALIRGTSRSGISILTAQSRGLSRAESAEYAFLIGIPVIFLGMLYQIYDFIVNGAGDTGVLSLFVGFVAAFISGYLAIKFLLSFLQNYGLKIFGYYRIFLGLIVLLIIV